MGRLYKEYCYSSSYEIELVITSNPILDGLGIISSVTRSGNDITVNYINTQSLPATYTVVPPWCTTVGFVQSYADNSVFSSGVMIMLAICFASYMGFQSGQQR